MIETIFALSTSTALASANWVGAAPGQLGEHHVGLWLWSEPLRKRMGSVSMWRDRSGLRGFVGLPAHVAIMRKYQDLGVTRVTTWHTDDLDPHVIWRAASRGSSNARDDRRDD